jgi:uncharacterized RDD family membrane protein YckC
VSETASWLHRVGALFVDWFACLFAAEGAIRVGLLDANPNGTYTLALFVVESTVLVALAGGSFGQLVTGLRVVRFDGSAGRINLLGAFIRSFLVALIIPPLVFRPDGRGLHDMAVGSATVRLSDLQSGRPPAS